MIKKVVKVAVLALAFATVSTSMVSAHGGATDAAGCHHERKTGGYHCH
jgi:hypothetical protein